tara:strand:+ start:2945 stop:3151 length:207 start_codon:yes stop_codon:yes gene_type:complete
MDLYEQLQREMEQAQMHLKNAFKILERIKDRASQPPTFSEDELNRFPTIRASIEASAKATELINRTTL